MDKQKAIELAESIRDGGTFLRQQVQAEDSLPTEVQRLLKEVDNDVWSLVDLLEDAEAMADLRGE